MAKVLIVGGASRDTLHVAGSVVRAPGGAGLYTALAAERAGASVTMLAPRPSPMPVELRDLAERVDWVGPRVAPEDLPRFEIRQESGKAHLVSFDPGAEASLGVDSLPDSLDADYAYCIPLGDPRVQFEIVRALGARGCRVGAGTYPPLAAARPEIVRQIAEEADAFFCNEEEAEILFGSPAGRPPRPGQLLFVTRGPEGAWAFQGEHRTEVSCEPIEVVDPTGAGDIFCGTVLARLAGGHHPVRAAREGVDRAAQSVARVGPEALFEADSRVHQAPDPLGVQIDTDTIEAVGEVLSGNQTVTAFPFVGADFPAPGHGSALDFFFASTVLQFGFWYDDGTGYRAPMVAEIDGRPAKGSDALYRVFRRWLSEAPEALTPQALAILGMDELTQRLTVDDGTSPFPQMEARLELLRAYGRDMLALGLTPAEILSRANRSADPLGHFLAQLDHIGGLKEDPWRKKAALLAAILRQRPEGFLAGDRELPPIVDYHVQRSCLRMGLVRILDSRLEARLASRAFLSQEQHDLVRQCCYRAVDELVRRSGLSMGAVDYFLFQNRSRCPEMVEPECSRCEVDSACAHRVELFQPVRRVTFY